MLIKTECSSKSIPLPLLGITDSVRVCDTCHFKVTSKSGGSNRNVLDIVTPPGSGANASSKEDDDLQRAIQASLELSKKQDYKPEPKKIESPVDNGIEILCPILIIPPQSWKELFKSL